MTAPSGAPPPDSGSDAVAPLVEDFLARLRRGERPSPEEYVRRRPDLAERLRDVLPLLAALEGAAPPRTEAAPPPAPRVLGDYDLGREIGRGGMGVVYEATQRTLGRRVALKVMTAHLLADAASAERFRREAAAAGRVDHPAVCTVYDAGVADGLPYIAMRFVEGETLARRIARRSAPTPGTDPQAATTFREAGVEPRPGSPAVGERTPSTPAEVDEARELMRLVEEAARGLHAAHERGVLHRDVKPGNLMVTPEGRAVVLDFGLARALDDDEASLTRTGDLVGTPAYLSPEQIRGERCDRRTDVYALGVTLFEALAGRRPFAGPTRAALYDAILRSEPASLRRVAGRDLDVVVLTALAKDPAHRYLTALDFAEDLRRVRAGEPVLARPAPPWRRLASFARRRPATLALVLVSGALFAAGAGFFGYYAATRDDVALARAAARDARFEEELAAGFMAVGFQEGDRGVARFEAALAERPTPEAAAGLALACFEADRSADALAALDRFAGYAAEAPSLDLLRVNALRALGRGVEAEAVLARLAPPRHPVDRFVRGLSSLARASEGDRDAARASFDDFTEAAASAPRARQIHHVLRVRAAGYLGDRTLFAAAEEPLLALWPASPTTWSALGLARDAAGDAAGAVAALERAVALAPDDLELRIRRADALRKSGAHDRALAAARECVAAAPTSVLARFEEGLCLLDRGDPAAYAVFEEVLRRRPDFASASRNLALLDRREGRLGRARERLEAAKARRPRDGSLAHVLGVVRFESGDVPGALEAFEEASRLRPFDAETRRAAALAYAAAGRDAEALAAARDATRMAPKDGEAAVVYATLFDDAASPEESEAALRRAAELAPKNGAVRCLHGRALLRLGRAAEAASRLEEGRRLGGLRPELDAEAATWQADAERLAAAAPRIDAVLGGAPCDADARRALAADALALRRDAAACALFAADPAAEDASEDDDLRRAVIAAALRLGGAWDAPARRWLAAEIAAARDALAAGDATAAALRKNFEALRGGVARRVATAADLPPAEAAAWRTASAELEALLAAVTR